MGIACLNSSYFLIIKEHDIDIIGWFSDTDEITTSFNGITEHFYEILHHTICVNKINEFYKQPTVCYSDGCKPMFYEQINRVADYICGFVAEYNLQNFSVSKQKYCDIAEKIIADNENIVILRIDENRISKIKHSLKGAGNAS